LNLLVQQPKKATKVDPRSAALAGSLIAFQAIDALLKSWDSPRGPSCSGELLGGLSAFFFIYDRILKNGGVPYNAKPATDILEMIFNGRVSSADLHTLRAEAIKLVKLAERVTDFGKWQESIMDAEIYGLVHNGEWKGIGEAPAGFSAGA